MRGILWLKIHRRKCDIVCIFLNRFVSLMDNPLDNTQCQDDVEVMESERDRQCFDKEVLKAYLEDLKERGTLIIFKVILGVPGWLSWLPSNS